MEINFINYLDTNIRLQMELGYNNDPVTLNAFRNIKTDYNYMHSKNSDKSDVEIIKALYKEREENSQYYEQGSDLYMQEVAEMNILRQFIPVAPPDSEVNDYLKSLNYEKSKRNFKRFQDACEKQFGQKVNSQLILNYIES